MRRRLLNLVTALSLLLGLAAAGLWIVSGPMQHLHFFARGWEWHSFSVVSGGGLLALWFRSEMTPQPQYPWEWRHDPGTVSFEPAYPPTRHFFGLGFRTRRSSHRAPPYGMQTETLVIIPYWQLCVLGAVLPAWRAASWARRRRRRRPGHCRQCGYDLRASNNRCPECGTPTAPAAAPNPASPPAAPTTPT